MAAPPARATANAGCGWSRSRRADAFRLLGYPAGERRGPAMKEKNLFAQRRGGAEISGAIQSSRFSEISSLDRNARLTALRAEHRREANIPAPLREQKSSSRLRAFAST